MIYNLPGIVLLEYVARDPFGVELALARSLPSTSTNLHLCKFQS